MDDKNKKAFFSPPPHPRVHCALLYITHQLNRLALSFSLHFSFSASELIHSGWARAVDSAVCMKIEIISEAPEITFHSRGV